MFQARWILKGPYILSSNKLQKVPILKMTEPVGDLNVVNYTENTENGPLKYTLLLGSNLKVALG